MSCLGRRLKRCHKSVVLEQCPDDDELILMASALASGHSPELEEHIDGCAECRIIVGVLAKPELPRQIGRFVVERELGSGAMGVVLLARDAQLERLVAIKLVHTSSSTVATKDLLAEAKVMAGLHHKNIVTVYDIGQTEIDGNDQLYLAMEFIEGGTLNQWLSAEKRSWKQVTKVFVQAGEGLLAAHAAGIVHRDFKPDNVLVDFGARDNSKLDFPTRILVSDFGLAKVGPQREKNNSLPTLGGVEPDFIATATQSCSFDSGKLIAIGTPAYMSPEQFQGLTATAQSDQFSFSASLFEAVTGHRPFSGSTFAELSDHVLAETPLPMTGFPSGTKRLQTVLIRGLQLDPQKRYPDFDALLGALNATLSSERRWMAVAGGLIFASAMAGAMVFSRNASPPPLPCQQAAAKVETVWTPQVAAAIETQFEAAIPENGKSVWSATQVRVQQHATNLSLAIYDSCEATYVRQTQSERLHDWRSSCLHHQLMEFSVVLDILKTANRKVAYGALASVRGLPNPVDCDMVSEPSQAMAIDHNSSEMERALAKGVALKNAGEYRQARTMFETTVDLATIAGDDRILAQGQLGASDTFRLTDNLSEAESMYKQTILSAERSGSTAVRALALSGVAQVVIAGPVDKTRAVEMMDLAMAATSSLEPSDPAYSRVLLSLAQLALRIGDIEGAQESGERVRLQVQEGDPMLLAKSYQVLGQASMMAGKQEEARRYLSQSHDVVVTEYGPVHPLVAEVKRQIAETYAVQRNHSQARVFLLESIEIYKQFEGGESKATIGLHRLLGHQELDQDNLDAAAKHLEIAKATASTLYGAGHPDSMSHNLALSLVARRKGDFLAAKTYIDELIEVQLEHFGAEHPGLGKAYRHLCQVLYVLEKNTEGIAYCYQSEKIAIEAYGEDSVAYALAMEATGRVILQDPSGDGRVAEDRFAKVERIFRNLLSPTHSDIPLTQHRRARSLIKQGRIKAALKLLLEIKDSGLVEGVPSLQRDLDESFAQVALRLKKFQ